MLRASWAVSNLCAALQHGSAYICALKEFSRSRPRLQQRAAPIPFQQEDRQVRRLLDPELRQRLLQHGRVRGQVRLAAAAAEAGEDQREAGEVQRPSR